MVICDRTTLSIIYFEWLANIDFGEQEKKQTPNALDYSIRKVEQAARENQILLPPVLVYLHPESEAAFNKRLYGREEPAERINFLRSWQAVEAVTQWFRLCLRSGKKSDFNFQARPN